MLNYWCSGVGSTAEILWKWKSDAAQLGNTLMEYLEWRKGFWSGDFRFCRRHVMRNLCLSKNATNHRTKTLCDPRATLAGVKLRQLIFYKDYFCNFTFNVEPWVLFKHNKIGLTTWLLLLLSFMNKNVEERVSLLFSIFLFHAL